MRHKGMPGVWPGMSDLERDRARGIGVWYVMGGKIVAATAERKGIEIVQDMVDILQADRPPARERLPETGWLPVAELQVDFGYQHRPFSWAVDELAKAFRPELSGHILVNVRADRRMYIIDGQTRHAVHEKLGYRWIRAEILRGLSEVQEAQIYLIKAIHKARQPVDWFAAEVKAEVPQAMAIFTILDARGIGVESFAAEGSIGPKGPMVSCITALKRIYRMRPGSVREERLEEGALLQEVIDLVIDTWSFDKSALSGQFLEAVAGILAKHGDDIDRKSFIHRLGEQKVDALRDQARTMRHTTTPAISLRTATQRKIIEYYNLRRQTGRIGHES